MEKKLLVWLIAASLLVGCLGQSQPTPTLSPTPVNRPPVADFSYSWTGGDENQPWTCSKITFKAEVSDPDGDYFYLLWLDNGSRIPQALGRTEFETKLWPDGIHTIKLVATDLKGAKTVVEKQINVKYEVPEPIPVQNKNGLNIAAMYTPIGIKPGTHPEYSWSVSIFTSLLGQYDMTNPVTIDWHIKWALEHGINTFWIAVAPHGNPPEKVKGSYALHPFYGNGFLESKYKDRIKFNAFLNMDRYNPFNNKNYPIVYNLEKDIEILSRYYFNQLNYQKVDGKPVLYLYSTDWYLCQEGCTNEKEREELLKSHLELIRETVKKNGYDLFLIGDTRYPIHYDGEELIIDDVDATTSYNLMGACNNRDKYKWRTDEKGRSILIAPYDDMVVAAIERELSDSAKRNGKVYVPGIYQGFNNEKRFNMGYNDNLIKRTDPTPNKFEEFVSGVKPLINPELNLLLTTFNEFTENNVIEPTKEFGFAYLDIIRDNFAIKPPGGWPPNVVPSKNCGCVEYKNWNTEIGMPPPFVFVFFGMENLLLKVLKARKEENY